MTTTQDPVTANGARPAGKGPGHFAAWCYDPEEGDGADMVLRSPGPFDSPADAKAIGALSMGYTRAVSALRKGR